MRCGGPDWPRSPCKSHRRPPWAAWTAAENRSEDCGLDSFKQPPVARNAGATDVASALEIALADAGARRPAHGVRAAASTARTYRSTCPGVGCPAGSSAAKAVVPWRALFCQVIALPASCGIVWRSRGLPRSTGRARSCSTRSPSPSSAPSPPGSGSAQRLLASAALTAAATLATLSVQASAASARWPHPDDRPNGEAVADGVAGDGPAENLLRWHGPG
jgi:hypothetical protein